MLRLDDVQAMAIDILAAHRYQGGFHILGRISRLRLKSVLRVAEGYVMKLEAHLTHFVRPQYARHFCYLLMDVLFSVGADVCVWGAVGSYIKDIFPKMVTDANTR